MTPLEETGARLMSARLYLAQVTLRNQEIETLSDMLEKAYQQFQKAAALLNKKGKK